MALNNSKQRPSRRVNRDTSEKSFPLLRILLVVALVLFLIDRFSPPLRDGDDTTKQAALSNIAPTNLSSSAENGIVLKDKPLSTKGSSSSSHLSSIPEREWFRLESKSLGGGGVRLTYRFPSDTLVWGALTDTARIPETIREMVVEALLYAQEYALPLEATFVLNRDHDPLSWGWKAGTHSKAYRLSARGWVDEKGCSWGSACPWKEFIQLSGTTLPGGVWQAAPSADGVVFSFIEGKISDVQQRGLGWSVVVYRPPEFYAEWRGLHQLAPNVRVGVMVDAGTPIGSSLKQPIQLRVQVLGRPVDPVEVWKQAWGEPQLKEIEDEEG